DDRKDVGLMAEPKVGDRISLDAKKVGQPRRGGGVRDVRQRVSGTRVEIEWDAGSRTVISPGAGALLVEGRSKGNGSKKHKAKAAKSGSPKAAKGKKKSK